MSNLPIEIYPVAAVREIDRCAIEEEAIPGYTLMTRAATAALDETRRRFPDRRRWQVVCGAGNNGGDGYVVARLASEAGIAVSVVSMVDPGALTGDAATAHGDFVASGGAVSLWSGDLDADADLLVDAMLGSGLERAVSGPFAAAVTAINAHPAVVVALDIPTGIHGDSGDILGCAVAAEATVTFVGLKAGLFLNAGASHSGEVVFAGLDIPAHCRAPSSAVLRRIDDADLREHLPKRRRDAHKGEFGHVLVVGGSAGMAGAVRLCGEAALRAGAGRVSIATDPAHAGALIVSRPELMSHGVGNAAELEPLLAKADVVAFGPGLGQTNWSQDLYSAIAALDMPAVWDADALNLLALHRDRKRHRIITPHPGEAGTLLVSSARDVQADRIAALHALEDEFGGTAVLKGAGTLVSAGDLPPSICLAGNPGMAAAGMGDVLTGIIAGLLAQGLPPAAAATVGVEAHARAGDRAAQNGERGLLASDLVAELRTVLNP